MLIRTFVRAPEGGGSTTTDPSPANQAPNPPPPPAPQLSEAQTFSREYVQELRRENETWRHKARGHETAAEQARREKAEAERARDEAVEQARKDAETTVTAARQAANERIVRAEVKAAATRAGMVDMDGLKLLDLSAITLDDAGEVAIPEKFFEDAKRAKPWLFGAAPGSTSHPGSPPPTQPPARKSAKEMSDEEFGQAMRTRSWRA